MIPDFSYNQFLELYQDNKAILVDVRGHKEYLECHIPEAIDIPLSDLADYDFSAHQDKTVIFHCGGGSRAAKACDIALVNNVNLSCGVLQGGFRGWKARQK